MGLAIGIGELALAAEESDSDFLDGVRENFATINEVLAANSLPPHNEPDDFELPEMRCPVDGFPYSCLHYLRRFASYVLSETPQLPTPVHENERPEDDPQLACMCTPRLHLLYHSDCEGYYVPIDFTNAILDDRLPGQIVGSTYRLRDELVRIAPYLGIQLDDGKLGERVAEELRNQILSDDAGDYATEKMVWFSLFDAADQGIEHKSAIVFG